MFCAGGRMVAPAFARKSPPAAMVASAAAATAARALSLILTARSP
jgi:hypothetical protein